MMGEIYQGPRLVGQRAKRSFRVQGRDEEGREFTAICESCWDLREIGYAWEVRRQIGHGKTVHLITEIGSKEDLTTLRT